MRRAGGSNARAIPGPHPNRCVSSTASQSGPLIRSSTDVRVRNETSASERCDEQFGAQIVRHQPVVAGERDAGVLPRAAGLQCERREVQPDRPSFGAVEQLVHLGVSELHAGGIEQRAPLESRHRELVDTDLYDVTRRREAAPWGAVVRRASRARAASRLGRWSASSAIVSRHSSFWSASTWSRTRTTGSFIPDIAAATRDATAATELTAVSRSQHFGSDGVDPIEGGGGVRHQPPEIIVVPVDREPRDARRVTPRPFGQQRRLAVARRRGNDRDRHVRRIESIDERGTGDERRVGDRRMQLRLEEILRGACARTDPAALTCAHRGRPPASARPAH